MEKRVMTSRVLLEVEIRSAFGEDVRERETAHFVTTNGPEYPGFKLNNQRIGLPLRRPSTNKSVRWQSAPRSPLRGREHEHGQLVRVTYRLRRC